MSEGYKEHVYAVIYCGGGGTRLWPYSREKRPKQFLKIGSDKTLIKKTFERLYPEIPLNRIYVITLPDYTDEVKEELPMVPRDQVLVEPARRDTLLAAGYATAAILKKDSKAIIANIWADQVIEGVEGYRKAIYGGAKVVSETKSLVTTAVKAEYAHPGLEYVQKGKLFKKVNGVGIYKVNKFIERPERSGKKPESVFKNKKNLWHIGLWIWEGEMFMNLVKKNSNPTYQTLMKISENLGQKGGNKVIENLYKKSPKVQIDMVVSKNSKNMYVVEGKYEWLDVGDFSVMWRMSKKDKNGNIFINHSKADWINIDSINTLLLTDGEPLQVATIGLTDLVVVVTKNAVLVADRKQAQKVKQVVTKLKEGNKKEYL